MATSESPEIVRPGSYIHSVKWRDDISNSGLIIQSLDTQPAAQHDKIHSTDTAAHDKPPFEERSATPFCALLPTTTTLEDEDQTADLRTYEVLPSGGEGRGEERV